MEKIYAVVDHTTGEVLGKTFKLEDLDVLIGDNPNARAVFEPAHLQDLSIKKLARIYSELSGKLVSTFETKDTGIKRLIRFLNPENRKEAIMATKTNTKSKATAAKKKTAARKTTAKKAAAKKAPAKKAASKKSTAPKANGLTKTDKMRALFDKKGAKHTLDDIIKHTGYDRRNAITAIGILKNPNRTTDPIVIVRKGNDYIRA